MAAERAFTNMPPLDRMQFGQYVEQQLQAQGMPMQGFGSGSCSAAGLRAR